MCSQKVSKRGWKASLLILPVAAIGLSACVTNSGGMDEGIGYREARFEQISAMREYRQCRDDALDLDTKARQSGDTARYLASAKLLEKCEASLGAEASGVAKEERLRSYALSITNYFKGGDIEKARENLERLQQAQPDADLYFADGSSFIDTMEVLLSTSRKDAIREYSTANVNSELKADLRRVRYWKRH